MILSLILIGINKRVKWFVFFLLLSSTAFCQQLIEGTIVDKETGKPVPFASIGIIGTSKGTSSNSNGEFSISLAQPFKLKITCVGYESKEVSLAEEIKLVQLKPISTQLDAIVILDKAPNPKKIVRKAFANIAVNYINQPFLQNFFYRHYCKDDSVYGRLIEASVDVWKHHGYRSVQGAAGDQEEIRVTQLRRSLDKTTMAQGHDPISIKNILQADVVGYQTKIPSEHLLFYTDVSNLKTDFENYTFSFDGITNYDGQEVYQISYAYKKDSVVTTSGSYLYLTQATGSLFITTDTFAFIKTEEVKKLEPNTLRTAAYYRKFNDRYYPYHFIREGKSYISGNSTHSFRIDLMSVELKTDSAEEFTGNEPDREELLAISYDSVYWNNNTTLKITPLENKIIHDLGDGVSLNKQFYLYRQYELNLNDGGKNGEEKFNWYKANSQGKRVLYLVFWSNPFNRYLVELELAKQLQKQYRNKISFVFISLDDDQANWLLTLSRYGFYADGIINYRVGSNSGLAKLFHIKEAPAFILLSKNGEVFSQDAKRPSNPLLQDDFKFLLK